MERKIFQQRNRADRIQRETRGADIVGENAAGKRCGERSRGLYFTQVGIAALNGEVVVDERMANVASTSVPLDQ